MTEAAAAENKTDEQQQENKAEPTIEQRAEAMGWTPKEKFRGAADKWVDAATFVKIGEESLPVLRERLKKAEKTAADLGKSLSEFKKMSDENFEKGYAKAKQELEAKIEAAAEQGGKEAAATAKAATKELAALEGEKARRDAKGDADPVFDGWVGQNEWYNDADMRLEAEAEAFKLRKRGDKSEGVDFLDKVKEQVKKRFPDKFGNPRRANGGQTERPSAGGEETANRGKKGWEHLPAEAKEAGERYVKQKIYKDKAAYAEAFWAQN